MIPTVLIPGLACTSELFALQLAALWPNGAVMIASTLEGGTIVDMAGAILAQAPRRFALAGLSMGGYVSLEIMRQAPERVAGLALLDTSARPDAPEQIQNRHVLMARVRRGEFDAVLAETAPKLLHPDRRDDPGLIGVQQRMGHCVGPDAYCRQQEAIIGRADSRPHLAKISVPTLVLVGDKDGVTPPDHAREMADVIPGAKLGIIRDAGHLSTLEQPTVVNHALAEWLSSWAIPSRTIEPWC